MAVPYITPGPAAPAAAWALAASAWWEPAPPSTSDFWPGVEAPWFFWGPKE